jgi:valyl-tRNA synthetase
MMMMGESFMGELPFNHIYLHALVRDENGQKMSKSKGNVIDPLDMVESYNADIVRFSLSYLAIQGRDIKLGEKHLLLYRNFTNKLFNASKFLLMNADKFEDLENIEIKTPLGLYMQSRLSKATNEIRNSLDSYKFHDSASVIYNFVWNEFCDIGIELSKADKDSIAELGAIFKEILKLINPFMPFISEHLYQNLNNTILEDSISIMKQPYPKDIAQDENIENIFNAINDSITAIRRIKTTLNSSDIKSVYLRFDNKIDEKIANVFIKRLAKVDEIFFIDEPLEDAFCDVSKYVQVYVKKSGFDITPILNKLEKQKEKLEKEKSKLNGMLNNKNFVANAPKDVLEKNNTLLEEVEGKLKNINDELERIK